MKPLALAALLGLFIAACAAQAPRPWEVGEEQEGVVADRWPALPETGGRWLVSIRAETVLLTLEVTADEWLRLEPGTRVTVRREKGGRVLIGPAKGEGRPREGAEA